MRINVVSIAAVLLSTSYSFAQTKTIEFPRKVVIAQHSFIDVGPPNDFYELIQLIPKDGGVSVERVLITPEGQQCLQPATVETRVVSMAKTLPELLQGKNPCALSDKELHRELKRCKKCMAFSGMNVTMQASCGTKEREFRMDILDRDMFDASAGTPEHTSWTMKVLSEIDEVSGPGGMDKPIFPVGEEKPSVPVRETDTVRALSEGKYDRLFGLNTLVSQVVAEAEEPLPPPPTVALISTSPFVPVTSQLPKIYPPIARATRIEGIVTVRFDIDLFGKTSNIAATDGPKMLQGSAIDAVKEWTFPENAFGHSGDAKLEYRLNCQRHIHTNVN